MSITGITGSSQTATIGLISGTGEVQSSSVSDVMTQGQGTDQAQFSQGAKLMSRLQKLQSSDPEQFKEAAQSISDQLAEKAKTSTNTEESKRYSEMAAKFAEAAETGTMDSLKPPSPPKAQGNATGQALRQFGNHKDDSSFMSSVDSIIANALSGAGASSSGSTTSTDTDAAVEATTSTAA